MRRLVQHDPHGTVPHQHLRGLSATRPLQSLTEVNASAAMWDLVDVEAAAALRMRHLSAAAACARLSRQTLGSGGWCLRKMADDRLFGAQRRVQLTDGASYMMPGSHVEADELIVSGLIKLCASSTRGTCSILDLGAGVGQYGHALRSRHARVAWRGYDGAGDVERFTDGYVHYADLTLPTLALPRADYVLSLEVGEHIPREHELTLVRNLHAHACRGVVLSWACYGGHQHVNRRSNEHVIGIFEALGYAYDRHASHEMRRPPLRAKLERNYSNRVYGWFARSLMIFHRLSPATSGGCAASPPHHVN